MHFVTTMIQTRVAHNVALLWKARHAHAFRCRRCPLRFFMSAVIPVRYLHTLSGYFGLDTKISRSQFSNSFRGLQSEPLTLSKLASRIRPRLRNYLTTVYNYFTSIIKTSTYPQTSDNGARNDLALSPSEKTQNFSVSLIA